MSDPSNTATAAFCPALAALGTAILFWSSVPLLLKYFTHLLDAWTVNGLRYTFAALFWLPFVLRHRREVPPGRNIWKDAIPPAAVPRRRPGSVRPHAVFQRRDGHQFRQPQLVPVRHAVRVHDAPRGAPARARPAVLDRRGGNLAGLVAMYMGGLGTTSTSARGMLLLVVTAAFWGLYSVLVRKFMRWLLDARLGFGVVSLYAAPCLLALMFAVGNWKPVLHIEAWLWVLIWISAIAGIALGHVLFYRAIHALGPIASEGSLLLIPFATSVLAFFTLGERLGRLQWIGGLVLVFGCLFLILAKTRFERREEATAPVD